MTTTGKVHVAAMINDWENMQNRNPSLQYRFDFIRLRTALRIAPE